MNLFSAIYDYIRNHTYARERARKYRTLPHGWGFSFTLPV